MSESERVTQGSKDKLHAKDKSSDKPTSRKRSRNELEEDKLHDRACRSPDNTASSTAISDEELERLAVEELLQEAKKGKVRAEQVGPAGWCKRQARTNKRFLNSVLVSTMASNKRHSKTEKRK